MMDFEVLQILNTKVFAILDVSDYETPPTIAEVYIKFPNFKKRYFSALEVGGITILNTKILNQDDCVNHFPDGIYELEFKVDGKIFNKKIFRTTSAQIALRKRIANNNSDFNVINKIYLSLQGAEGVCDDDNLAKEFYNIADNLLKC